MSDPIPDSDNPVGLPAKPADQFEHVTATRRDGVFPGPEMPAPVNSGKFGCVGALITWTIGWVVVAWLAILTARQTHTFSAKIGVAFSVAVALMGIRLVIGLAGGRQTSTFSTLVGSSSPMGGSKSWRATLIIGATAIAWNFVTFGALMQLAKLGDGWLMPLVFLLTLIGLLFLTVLFAMVGARIGFNRS